METEIRAFFSAYAQRFNDSLAAGGNVDVAGVVGAFAPYFVQSGPDGVRGGKNGLLFRWIVPRGFARYRRIGTKLMRVDAIVVTEIDELHALARVSWHSEYEKRSGERVAIDFPVTYMLRIGDAGPQIFGFVAGDEQKALREHGLI
jgi:hypothetical protein